MAAGAQITTQDVNVRAQSIALQLKTAFREAQDFNQWLTQNNGVSGLTAAPYNFTQTDAQNIVSAMNDADLLRQIYEGSATQSTPKDFRSYLRWLWGFG